MKKLREFYIPADKLEEHNGLTYNMGITYIRVREIDPSFDALVLEMVEALGRFDRNIAERHEASDILAKYDAYVRGEKE